MRSKPARSDQRSRVAAWREQHPRPQGVRRANDKFGSELGTQAAAINAVMSLEPQSLEQIGRRTGLEQIGRQIGYDYTPRIRNHMRWLAERELATGSVREGFRLTPRGASIIGLGARFSTRRQAAGQNGESDSIQLAGDAADETDPGEDYVLSDADYRESVERQIRKRRGQSAFRNTLRKRYGDRCLISGCEILAVLEAAHIKPYRGQPDHHPKNGLLLRTDLHTLFDLDLIGIEPDSLTVRVHPDLIAEYGQFDGATLRCRHRPSREALQLRYAGFLSRRRKPA